MSKNSLRAHLFIFTASLASAFAVGACGHDNPPAADPGSALDGGAAPVVTPASSLSGASSATSMNATAASTANSATASAADGGAIAVDQQAPDFSVTDQNGEQLSLAGMSGHPVVLYFYPKDETPGCTKEACSFRDTWDQLAKDGAVLIGVSADTDESHKKFAANHKLPFHLVSDPNNALGSKFGVTFTKYHARQTILIGPNGVIRRIYRNVSVDTHAQDIAAALRT